MLQMTLQKEADECALHFEVTTLSISQTTMAAAQRLIETAFARDQQVPKHDFRSIVQRREHAAWYRKHIKRALASTDVDEYYRGLDRLTGKKEERARKRLTEFFQPMRLDPDFEPAVREAFGEALKEMRGRRGLSQEEMARMADLDRTFVSQVERGISNPSITTLFQLCGALTCTVGELAELCQAQMIAKGWPAGSLKRS